MFTFSRKKPPSIPLKTNGQSLNERTKRAPRQLRTRAEVRAYPASRLGAESACPRRRATGQRLTRASTGRIPCRYLGGVISRREPLPRRQHIGDTPLGEGALGAPERAPASTTAAAAVRARGCIAITRTVKIIMCPAPSLRGASPPARGWRDRRLKRSSTTYPTRLAQGQSGVYSILEIESAGHR